VDDVVAALTWADRRGVPVCVLGGGSNVLVADEGVDALVLRPRLRGVELLDKGDHVRVRASAGEPWDELVERSVRAGLLGIECLSGIPGEIGAAPIQNIGAYGQELSQTAARVEVLCRETREVRVLSAEDCAFGYRDSVFKREARDRYVVLSVELRLRQGGEPELRYPELARAMHGLTRTGEGVRRAVLELRRSKSMLLDRGCPDARSAGSFFVNPTVDPSEWPAFEATATSALAPGESIPRYPAAGGRIKLSAAWLIERAGFVRGTRDGAVGISSRHSLAIVALEGATARNVVAFAQRIQARVLERFGVRLVPEPVRLGFTRDELAEP
jgi:UDP-N-acetylmuramate dehydrogenase